MRNMVMAIFLTLAPTVALADGDAPKVEPPADAAPAPAPVAPKLLEGTKKPKDIAAKDSHRDTDHVGGRECTPNAMGVVTCAAPAPEPKQPQPTATSTLAK